MLFDLIYWAVYCLFLLGASLHLRGRHERYGFWVMNGSVLIDFFATILPNDGCKSLAINIGAGPEIVSAIVLGVIIWSLFLGAVFVRLVGKTTLFHGLIAAIQIMWFVDIVLFFSGVYNGKA